MGDLLVTTISLGSFGLRVQLFFQIPCSCGWNALTILLLVEGIKRESSYSGIKPRACTQDLCLMLSVNIRCWTNELGDCFHAKWFGKGGRDKRDVCAKRKGGEIMAAAMRIRRCDGVCALWGGEVEVTNKNQLPTSPTSSSTYLPLPSTTNHS